MSEQTSEAIKKDSKKSRPIIKIILLTVFVGLIIVLGVIFIPGFFRSKSKTDNSTSPTTSYTTESASLLGLEKKISSPHFTIYFHEANEKDARNLISTCEKYYPSLAGYFASIPRTEILLTFDANEYANVFNATPPWGGRNYDDPNTSAGSFCPGCTKSLGNGTEYVYMLRSAGRSLAHELSHRYFWANYPSLRYDNSLTWLNEGEAVYIQTKIDPGPGGLSGNASKITKADVPGSFTEFNELQQQGNPERFYDLAGLLAGYINDKSAGGLKGFLTDLAETKSIDKTAQIKLGFGADQLLSKWQETLP